MDKPTDDEMIWALAKANELAHEALESVEFSNDQWKLKVQDYPENERGSRTSARVAAQTALAFLRQNEHDTAVGLLMQAVRDLSHIAVHRAAESRGYGLYDF
ncbi:hypothetical protein [Streptomyces sp. NPDC093261]|uniref:hypothetical protein n=1 Tax=Streptomyces sp. NPDC093261 TaxID=3366037 RepID=UPI00380FEFA5